MNAVAVGLTLIIGVALYALSFGLEERLREREWRRYMRERCRRDG